MNRHRLDPVSLVFGALFALLGALLAFSDIRWEKLNTGWVIPGVLVLIGGAILWSTLRRLQLAPDGEAPGAEQPDPDEWSLPDEAG